MDLKKTVTSPASALLLSAALSAAVYYNIVHNGLVYDDHFVITRNRWIEDFGYIWSAILSSEWSFMPGSPTVNYYRPTFHILNMTSRHLFGPEPWGFHLSSIMLHTANTVLVLLMARRLVARWSLAVLLSGLFFAAHPVHVESVAWLSAESDLIYALFVLTGFYLYSGRGRGAGRWVAAPVLLSAVAFFCGLVSKETAVVLPVLALVYDLLVRREPILPLLPWVQRYLPYTVAFALYFALRLYALGGLAPETVRYNDLTPYQGFVNIFLLIPMYIGKLFWPVGLNISHAVTPLESFSETKAMLAVLFLALFAAFIVWLARKNRLAAFLCIWVLIPLFPALYIPALGRELFAERYLYLPSAGFVIAASIGIERLMQATRRTGEAALVAAAVVTVVAGYSAVSIARTFDWRSDYTIWSDAVEKSPESGYPHQALAIAAAALGKYDEAAEEYEKSLALDLVTEDRWRAEHNSGRTYMELGRLDDAVAAYNRALAIHPDKADTHFNLSLAYEKKGMLAEASKSLLSAIENRPRDQGAYMALGRVNMKLGDFKAAISYYGQAVAITPSDPDARNALGAAYAELGDLESAVSEFRAALDRDPGNERARANLKQALKILEGR